MSESFEEKLIDQVRNYPHLYDVSLPLHSDKYACQNSWREISDNLQSDAETCKIKWKQVRDRCQGSKEDDGETEWGRCRRRVLSSIVRRLGWLSSFINHRSTETNFPQSRPMCNEETTTPSPGSTPEPDPSPDPSTSSQTTSGPSTSSRTPTAPRRKKRPQELDPVDAALLQRLAEVREEARAGHNIYTTFGSYMGMFLQQLDLHNAQRLMKEVKQLMQCYE
uniref:MADF domain-containing protein n=2 Tax=Nothobranchius pienaari TaxID=704102 RepID=A0A1A8M2Y1_9TELE